MSEEQKRLLEKQLWGVADVLRGKMNADEYKNYILGFIFYKYLSEKLERYVNEKLLKSEDFKFAEIKENTKDGKKYLEHIKEGCIDHLGFFLNPTELFVYLVKKGIGEIKGETTFILEDLKNILNKIEQTSMGTASEDDFKELFDDVDLTSAKLGNSEKKKNEVIVEVLTLLSGIDFQLEDTKSDILGDAYEYLIGEFAAGAGKKGGEFYTPAQVSRLLAQIVSLDKKRVRSVYDPTCGSGSLLLRLKDYAEVTNYYGQELNQTTYNLARMNMILHGVHFDHFAIRQGDTLMEDMHIDLMAEAIIANPPFSAEWKGDKDPLLAHDDRFSQYGRLAPKSAADYAFVTHMLYHLADNGTMAVVLPHGALFRSGAEGHIRKYIIKKQNYLDAVIGLPQNLFYGNSIPVTVLIFKKCRKDDDDILFIDASKEFEKEGNKNKLTDENIKKIFETYRSRKEIKRYSHKASLVEIKENEYNLNILRYVDTFEEEEPVDIEWVVKNLFQLAEIEKKINLKIWKYCNELKIPEPKGNNLYLLKEYKKGVMQKIFSQEIRFKDENGKEFPKWEKKKLGDVLNLVHGYQFRSSDFTKDGLAIIKIGNVIGGDLNLQELSYISIDRYDEFKKYEIHEGDILMSLTGNIGRVIEVRQMPFKLIQNYRVGKFVPYNMNELSKKFTKHLLMSNKIFGRFSELANQSAQANFGKQDMDKIKIELPSLNEQQKIADFLTSIDGAIELKEQQITEAERWKKGLMQQLFI